MTPYFDNRSSCLYMGHVLEVLAQLPAESVDVCMTSPPFWGLRNYRLPPQVWDGDSACAHEWTAVPLPDTKMARQGSTETVMPPLLASQPKAAPGTKCVRCGAWLGDLGMEPTPDEYIHHLVEVFRAVWRVLRPWGSLWIEVGDSRAGSGSPGGDFRDGKGGDEYLRPYNRQPSSIPAQDLIGIPWRLAFALQADGWHLKMDNIWHHVAPMPESVNGWNFTRHQVKIKARVEVRQDFNVRRNLPGAHASASTPLDAIWADCPGCAQCLPNDGLVLRQGQWRTTEAHSYVFQFAKTDRYFADREAVKQPTSPASDFGRNWQGINGTPFSDGSGTSPRLGRGSRGDPSGRNPRSVWPIGPSPLPQHLQGQHFAIYPEEVCWIPILSSTSEKGNCARCGMPWARIVEVKPSSFNVRVRDAKAGKATPEEGYKASEEELANYSGATSNDVGATETLGWRPVCKCGADEVVPALVLDPFVGTGTSLVVAQKHGRRSIGIELSESYCKLARRRLEETPVGMVLA